MDSIRIRACRYLEYVTYYKWYYRYVVLMRGIYTTLARLHRRMPITPSPPAAPKERVGDGERERDKEPGPHFPTRPAAQGHRPGMCAWLRTPTLRLSPSFTAVHPPPPCILHSPHPSQHHLQWTVSHCLLPAGRGHLKWLQLGSVQPSGTSRPHQSLYCLNGRGGTKPVKALSCR